MTIEQHPLKISNKGARRLWLHSHALSQAPVGALDVMGIIRQLGFVQLDSIRNVTRAHHHILWSRNNNYREPMLGAHLSTHRDVFEHFCHDACVLPMEYYPIWRKQFARLKARIGTSSYYKTPIDPALLREIKTRIKNEGALCTRAFNTKITGNKEMWSRPPHKQALDYLWNIGELATAHRENFTKFYDLPERIIPQQLREQNPSQNEQIDWLCTAALQRLGFATPIEIAKFWDAVDRPETLAWVREHPKKMIKVNVQASDGSWHERYAVPDIEDKLANAPPPTTRLRILNPFDPAIRDRKRLYHLFRFTYKNEIFVPAAKRQYGYYVYPLLQGHNFIGRIEITADRKAGILTVKNLWHETGVKWTSTHDDKLAAELSRLARFVGCSDVSWT